METMINDDDTLPGWTLEETDIIEGMIEFKRSSPVFIDDLPDAVVNGVPMFKEGDLLVVEKWLTISLKPKWLGTALCRVKRIDPLGSGDITLHDEELSQAVHANYITGPKHGWRFKLGNNKVNLRQRERNARGLERIAALSEAIGPTPSMLAVGSSNTDNAQSHPNVPDDEQPVPRRKWRPKAVRDAEKKRIKEERAARKAARAARKVARA